jgi:hypothetical protein
MTRLHLLLIGLFVALISESYRQSPLASNYNSAQVGIFVNKPTCYLEIFNDDVLLNNKISFGVSPKSELGYILNFFRNLLGDLKLEKSSIQTVLSKH